MKFLTGSFAERLQHIDRPTVHHIFQWRQSFDECFVQFFTTSQFVSESPELRLAFPVSARLSPSRGGKLPPAPARCGSDECLLGLSFCSRRTMRWGKAISIPAARALGSRPRPHRFAQTEIAKPPR